MVGNDTDCENSWNVTVMHCDGYNVAKLKPTYNETNRCAKYCIGEQMTVNTVLIKSKCVKRIYNCR